MYNKLFSSIVHSSIWQADMETKIMWVTILALKDKKGFVFASISGLAHAAVVSKERAIEIVAQFEAPDPESSDLFRNPENEGRRLERVDGGWRVINNDYYNSLASADERREADKERKRAERAVSAPVRNRPQVSATVRKSPPSDTDTDTDTTQTQIQELPPPPNPAAKRRGGGWSGIGEITGAPKRGE